MTPTDSHAPSPDELPPTYVAADIESPLYARWTEHGVFTADATRAATREPFVIVMPPPNVTAVLHVGHGLNNTVQDVLIRWRRMAGDEALWVPGTDHAGIATQNVVEKALAVEGKTRADLGREPFVARVAEFVEQTGGEILNQLKAIGSSADWTRTAYTFTPELSRSVREAFVRLHEDGLVYKGHRVIHWCPRCGTSLSDEEAEFTETAGKLYHIRYLLADDPSQSIIVATTRPETMLGDSAVAVHPDDQRYRALVGRDVVLPINGVRIPVVADGYTDPAFGSGAVKITPAHDANDFEVGKRHGLPMPVVIDAQGIVRETEQATGRVPAELAGLDRVIARARIVEMLEAAGALVRVEPHQHSVRHCYRCDTVVEPRLSDQWFVRMQPLAAKALDALRSGQLRILPDRWEAVYVNWLEGIRDWNISRQIWWGHRIPVWYCTACDHAPIVSRDDVTACPSCGGTVRQDEDVLDTWFSSWLWPFSTLGWPDKDAPDLKAFYPGDVLVTAPEILFFWVSRMVMSGCWFLDRPPFHTVYLHGTVRDMQHRKMSKSLGNGIDPLDVVQLYGADALRWTMVAGLGLGVDVMLDPSDLDASFAPGRNFCTKLWNISRFLLTRVGTDPVTAIGALPESALTPADAWILDRLDAAIADCDAALGPARPADGVAWSEAEHYRGLRLSEYAEAARRFVWNELADWYLESAKPRLAGSGVDRETARAVLVHAFDGALRLLHPIVPFITETLWQRLPESQADTFLAQAPWPRPRAVRSSNGTSNSNGAAFELAREAVQGIRQIRSEYNVKPSAFVDAVIVSHGEQATQFTGGLETISTMTRSRVTVATAVPSGVAAHLLMSGGSELVIPLADIVDLDRERQRIALEIESLEKPLLSLEGRLGNEKFLSKAPAELVDAERAKAAEWRGRLTGLQDKLRSLGA
ncbi:MAG TPA: valine--tRNA ligase [Gemmatimonas sp.]|nr:valine--tRNA ligase [Gemmatimonas sp.]